MVRPPRVSDWSATGISDVTAATNRSSSEPLRRSSGRSGQPLEVSRWQMASRRSCAAAGLDLEAGRSRCPAPVIFTGLHAVDREQGIPDRLGRAACFHEDRLVQPDAVELVVEGDLAPGDDDHPAADRLDLRHDVSREQDRMPIAQLADQGANLADLDRVEARGRLVEDQDVGVVDQRLGQADPLPEAPREVAEQAPFDVSPGGTWRSPR